MIFKAYPEAASVECDRADLHSLFFLDIAAKYKRDEEIKDLVCVPPPWTRKAKYKDLISVPFAINLQGRASRRNRWSSIHVRGQTCT